MRPLWIGATEGRMASMTELEPVTYDVCIVGTGMSGMAAALFAANRGLSAALIGWGGKWAARFNGGASGARNENMARSVGGH